MQVQGAMATDIYAAFPSLLRRKFDAHVLNMGFGGRRVIPADAMVLSALETDVMVVTIGTNEIFDEQVPGELESRFTEFLTLLRDTAQDPKPFLIMVTPPWSFEEAAPLFAGGLTTPEVRTILISAVEQFIEDTGDERIVLIDGLALITPTFEFLPDALHPNNQGFFQMAEGLAEVIASNPFVSDIFEIMEIDDEILEPPQPPLPPGVDPIIDLDCEVSQWSQWSPCTQTCGQSISHRSRIVTNLVSLQTLISANMPLNCPPLQEIKDCPIQPPCPECVFTEWSEWSACDVNCGSGSRTRVRNFITAWDIEAFEAAETVPTGIVDEFCQVRHGPVLPPDPTHTYTYNIHLGFRFEIQTGFPD